MQGLHSCRVSSVSDATLSAVMWSHAIITLAICLVCADNTLAVYGLLVMRHFISCVASCYHHSSNLLCPCRDYTLTVYRLAAIDGTLSAVMWPHAIITLATCCVCAGTTCWPPILCQ